MPLRSFFYLLVFLVFKINVQAQCEDYQMLKAINASGALINYLDQNGFKEASHPDSSFFYYEGKHKGDYLKVRKGWKGEVFEMGWAVVDENGNTIQERLRLGNLQFAATYKENRKLHPSIFGYKRPEPGGTWDFVNFDLGVSKVHYKFDEVSGSKNPKLTQIVMLPPNNRDRNLKAMNRRSRCLEKLATSNVPEGTNALVSEILDYTKFHFKKALSLSLKKDKVVTLDLPHSLLNQDQNKDAVIYIKPRKPNNCISAECVTTLNFNITTEDGEDFGSSHLSETSIQDTRYTATTHKLTNNLRENISFTAELSTSEDLDVDVYYFEGPTATEAFITHAITTNEIWLMRNETKETLAARDYVPPFEKSIQIIKGTSIFDPEISKDALPASGKTVIYNKPGSGSHIFLVKSEGQVAPTIKLDYELWWNEGDNRGNLSLDQNDKSYRFVDGYHLFEFQLNLVHTAWIKAEVINNEDKPHQLSWHSRYRKLDSTFVKFDIAETFHSRTEIYFERIIARNKVDPDRVKRAMEDLKNFGKKDEQTKGEYLNAVENRITAAATAGTNVSKSVKAILDQLGAGRNTSARLKQLQDEFKTFKAHISEATLNAIRGKCDNAYNILSNIEDDWFGYGGEAIQVDFANMENAANTGNQQAFARWTTDFTRSMQKIGDKLSNALSAVNGCR